MAASRGSTGLTVRVRCAGCNHITLFPATPAGHDWREGYDPYFDLPLFLIEPVGQDILWAWNPQHIELLAAWLGATLRERSTQPYHWSMVSRLPRWMKLASARPRVLHALGILRERALGEGIS